MIGADPPPDGSPAKREAERVKLDIEVEFRKSGYHKSTMDLQDLSRSGCKVELVDRVLPGETIWIKLPGLDSIPARVAWSRDWIAGLEFSTPLHPAVFEMLVARLKAGR
ncbi:MAG: hypothetical protein JWN69_2083 [Alphaproteobacteria bacterium]|jgi:hypothetical protein|nr:hypothetical protein [Alphaproteobacteria bacterium]